MKATSIFFFTMFTYFLGISTLAAAEVSKISGSLVDQNNNPIPFANVALIATNGGGLVDGTVSDEEGHFLIETLKSGEVTLVATSIGYSTYTSEVFQLVAGMEKQMGIVSLQDEMTGLDAVTVQSTRPEIIIEPDKTIVNVEGTVMAEGSNVLDVIGRSPGIYVDQDGIINLNGRTGVVVMINDRPTYMSATDLANFLRAMPADNIKSLEVINNPSARFDAEGSAGVINIILKKNTVDGVFGNVQAGGQYNGLWAPIAGLALNVKKNKWTTTLNLNHNQYAIFNDLEIERNFILPEGVSNFNQDSRIKQRDTNWFANGAVNYELNPDHNLGFNFQASTSNDDNINTSLTEIITPGDSENSFLDSDNEASGHSDRIFANLHYAGNLDTLGTKLSSDLDFTRMNADSRALLFNQTWQGEEVENAQTDQILTLNDMYYTIFTAKVDLVKPVGKNGAVMETGLKGSWVKSDNNLDLSRAFEDGPFMPDSSSNRFIYNENVLAAYASYKGKFSDKLSFQAGLRGEYSDITGNSVTLGQVNTQEYFNLFPSVFVQQQISEKYQIVYTANRRITRPNYRLLNPFIYYIDPLTSETGNPNLRPQYSNNFEMNHVLNGMYQFTLGYSETEDAFMQVFIQDEANRTTTTFTDNFDKTRNANFRAIVPVQIREWWGTSNMLQVNYNRFKSQIGDDLLDNSQTSFMLRSQHNLNLPKGFKVEVMGMYLGPQIWGQGEIAGFGWVDAGINKSIMKDRLSISVNATDIFRTQVIRAKVDFADIDTNFEQYRSNQGVRFTLRWSFAQGDSFRVNKSSGSDEERDRLNQ